MRALFLLGIALAPKGRRWPSRERKANGQVCRDSGVGDNGGEPERHRLLVRERPAAVSDVLRAARAHSLAWPLPEEMDDAAIRAVIYPKESRKDRGKAAIDHERISSELMRCDMTMSLLWNEYCDDAVARGEEPYMYSRSAGSTATGRSATTCACASEGKNDCSPGTGPGGRSSRANEQSAR